MDFSNINDIISSLSDEDMENLKSVAEGFLGGTQEKKEPSFSSFMPEGMDFQTIGKITRILGAVNSSSSDPRCDLIRALKPLLSQEKRKRADDAMRIIKLLDLLPLIKEIG